MNLGGALAVKTLWLVGRSYWQDDGCGDWDWTWDLHGIFDDEGAAAAICRDDDWFIAPVATNTVFPEEPQEFPDLRYPNTAEPARRKG